MCYYSRIECVVDCVVIKLMLLYAVITNRRDAESCSKLGLSSCPISNMQ